MGRLYAEHAVAEGAKAVTPWDRDAASLTSTEATPGAQACADTRVVTYVVDISDLGAIDRIAQQVRVEVVDPDIVINNAGIIRGK
ncbi:SDR family NAD(P)-dependent oxidoreductase [Cryobacterium sp. Y11]|uniref:SDR family NAD(P)-dependent oxidoreductase n=1 Tax=Cryobacterium sp. Y11 TaxID=2045016 RepID=UPI000CE302E3